MAPSLRSLTFLAAVGLVATLSALACSSADSAGGANAGTTTEPDGSATDPDGLGPGTSNDGGPTGKRDGGGAVDDSGSAKDSSTPCTSSTWYKDGDGDTFGDPSSSLAGCTKPDGYVANKTDCNDRDGKVKPGAIEFCDGVDNDCDGLVDGTPSQAATCAAMAGSYKGTYSMYTAERLGTTVINEMTCTGTSALTVSVSATPVVTGTVACTYPSRLGGFDRNQTGTLEASVRPDGTLAGKLTHVFESIVSTSRTFEFDGTIRDGQIVATGKGSWFPHPMSAVPWEVKFSFTAAKE